LLRQYTILKAARRDIPITAADFDLERSLDRARGESRQRPFWVAELKCQIAGVMMLRMAARRGFMSLIGAHQHN
jgi:hypothetical protein